MSKHLCHLIVPLVCLGLAITTGCCSRCASRCVPEGPWQSPTYQATRALLVVNTEELRILRIDGRNVRPSCLGRDGVREYHIPAGTHTITAVFRYAAPVSSGLLGEVHGRPLTLQYQFLAGHEYASVYREHAGARSKSHSPAQAVGATPASRDRYWSLEIVDMTPPQTFSTTEVAEARNWGAPSR